MNELKFFGNKVKNSNTHENKQSNDFIQLL